MCIRKAITGENTEEVSFKATFEGREGRSVMESERKRIPDLGTREAGGTTTMLFSFEEGNTKTGLCNMFVVEAKKSAET